MDNFEFYNNSANSGYNGGFGDYTDPDPNQHPMTPPPPKTPGQHSKGARIAALILACAVVGGASGVGGAALYNHFSHSGDTAVIHEQQRPKAETVVNTNKGELMTPEQLYAANIGSSVGITVSTTVNIFGQATTSAASGSGFVLTEDGYIVTNHHVVEQAVLDPSVAIEVSFQNGDKYTAKLVGSAKDNDVAVLKIEPEQKLTPVTLGDSSQLVVGEPVYAIGNPLGELTYSFTDGMVSALDRIISTGTDVTMNMLQTNCAINPGNSGGPLFDQYGNVIGITTAKYTQSQSGVSAEGLGFAIPINDVKDILKDLIEKGYVTGKPYLGVQLVPVSDDAQRYGIPAGAVVAYVAEDSAAQKAGLQVNDIIIKMDDTAIDSPSAMTAVLTTNYKAGDSATLTVIRQQQEKTLSITFDEKNSETEANNQIPQQPQQQAPQQVPGGSAFQFPFGFFPW